MSTLDRRLETLKQQRTKTLAEEISTLGIFVPDQIVAARMMEAMRLELPYMSTDRTIWYAWLRRFRFRNTGYTSFAFGRFVSDHTLARDWGGRMPPSIQATGEKIRDARIPGLSLKVLALRNDPWLVAERNGEHLILAGWYYDRRAADSIVILGDFR